MYEQELDVATKVARSAGHLILEYYSAGVVPLQKLGADDHYEPVTEADRAASRMIVADLKTAFPDDAVLSEEEVDEFDKRLSTRRVWIVDPIDGTAGFIRKDGDFAVHIGLADAGRAVLGVVYVPFYDVLYLAAAGAGSFVEQNGAKRVKLATSATREFDQMVVAISRNHPSERLSRVISHFAFRHVISRGSVGLKAGLIADRTCDIYVHPGTRTKLWDTCAPQAILEEAGGRFTDLFGNDLRYDRLDVQNHDGILASNGAAHDTLVEHLKPLLVEFGRSPFVRTGQLEKNRL